MLDDLGSRERAELGGFHMIRAARHPGKEAGGEKIAGAGRIDQAGADRGAEARVNVNASVRYDYTLGLCR